MVKVMVVNAATKKQENKRFGKKRRDMKKTKDTFTVI